MKLNERIEIGHTDDIFQFILGVRLEFFIALSQVLVVGHSKFEGYVIRVLSGRHVKLI